MTRSPTQKEANSMQYILAMYADPTAFAQMTPEQAQAFDAAINAYNDALRGGGAWVSAEGLSDVAQTVRFGQGGSTVSDGPVSQDAEQPAGFWIIEASSADSALDWARKVPLAAGAVEVRALVG
jgi:hypothetical protein